MAGISVHRPRNVDWKRAAALLYGDIGTSKAYVVGLAFLAAGYSSLPILLLVGILTVVVGINYVIICGLFPNGGGVYSSARTHSRFLAVLGALMLVADLTVTAAISGWAAISYFGVSKDHVATITVIAVLIIGILNYFGPKHTGSFAITLAMPMVFVVVTVILLSSPYLTFQYLTPLPREFTHNWIIFTNVILALSGIETIANLTGIMKLDPGSTIEKPSVKKVATKSVLLVITEVFLGTVFLGWAMVSIPPEMSDILKNRQDDMLRFLSEYYGGLFLGNDFGLVFGMITGVIIGLLLLSGVNTAITGLISLFYMMSQDGEMPRSFLKLNKFGVPWLPMLLATALPLTVLIFSNNLEALARLYAIGVVGAITVDIGSCVFNSKLPLKWPYKIFMGLTFAVLFCVEVTIAKTKPDALFFAVCVIGSGLGLRFIAQRKAGLRTVTVSKELAEVVGMENPESLKIDTPAGQSILVAARGITPVLKFAIEEAKLRKATIYLLYVKEVSVISTRQPQTPIQNIYPTPPSANDTSESKTICNAPWLQDDNAAKVICHMLNLAKANDISVVPLYMVSDDTAGTILDIAATLAVDTLIMGSGHRASIVKILKGDIVNEVANNLPDSIRLLIVG
jgi:amino acid transporter/nucleotide-binding universal stress UspA family protein